MSAKLELNASVEALLDFGLPTILLQALFIPGAKTDDGVLIEAVTLPWFEIVKHLVKDPGAMYSIQPRRWEEIIADAYALEGYQVTLTPRSGDLGRDVIATDPCGGKVRIVGQVKAYKPGLRVDADDVRALLGVMTAMDHVLADGIQSTGFVTTTSEFAPKIREDRLLSPFIPGRIELIDGKTLVPILSGIAAKHRS